MNPQEQVSSESTTQLVKSEAKKCNHIIIIVALAILTVGGFVFGGVELWQSMQKDDEIKALRSENDRQQEVVEENVTIEEPSQNNVSQSNSSTHWSIVNYSKNAFDKTKCKNCRQDLDYGVTAKTTEELYGWYTQDYENDVDFGKPVAYTFELGYGHDGHIVLYVFEDGTAGYTSMMNKFTYGFIPELQDVVGFIGGWIDQGEDVSASRYSNTIFAILSDGSYFSLENWLDELVKSGI